jgi:hypothetical protein
VSGILFRNLFIKGHNNSTPEELQGLWTNQSFRLSGNGGPGLVDFDDEEYLHDGMEYPLLFASWFEQNCQILGSKRKQLTMGWSIHYFFAS